MKSECLKNYERSCGRLFVEKKARESVRGRMTPTGKGGIDSIIITTDKSQADWEEEIYQQLMSKMDKNGFPRKRRCFYRGKEELTV